MTAIVVIIYCVGMLAMASMMFVSFLQHPAAPDRRTRGLVRWLGRCFRWTKRLGPPRKPAPFNEPVITQTQIRQMQQIGRAMAGVKARPSPAEFAAAPLYGHTRVDRLLKDLDVIPRRTHES